MSETVTFTAPTFTAPTFIAPTHADAQLELAMAKALIRASGLLLGIEVSPGLIDADRMADLFGRFSTAIDSLRRIAAADDPYEPPTAAAQLADEIRRGVAKFVSPAPSGEPTVHDPDLEDPDLDPGLSDDDSSYLRGALALETAALLAARDALNRITAAVGLDRWTPDGQPVVDRINRLVADNARKDGKINEDAMKRLMEKKLMEDVLRHLGNARCSPTSVGDTEVQAIARMMAVKDIDAAMSLLRTLVVGIK